jgi:mannose-6-phosphate isomerase-like protein (cupin superfamily)
MLYGWRNDREVGMRIESSVSAISWIPEAAIEGLPKLPFELGIGHYDPAPPEHIEPGDLERLRDDDRFREANHLAAWIEVNDGRITGYGNDGKGYVGTTTFKAGPRNIKVPGVAFETLQPEPEVGPDSVRFLQTVGGRAGFPAPRMVRGAPFFRVHSATAWTTLALTINADGSSHHEVVGASPFPRHWIYDHAGDVVLKAGTIDFKKWYRESHGENTPWGNEESEAFIVAAETALERQMSRDMISRGVELRRRVVKEGDALVEQGDTGDEMFLLLDGVLAVERDGEEIAEIGPGAIVGEGAVLGDGTRGATLRARTKCRVGVMPADAVDRESIETLAAARRE